MRISVIPEDRLVAIERGCPGFLEAVVEAADEHEPILRVMRQGSSKTGHRWYVEVTGSGSTKILVVDSTNVETMASVVPILLVDLVHDLQEELTEVMGLDGMMEGVAKVIPFMNWFKKKEKSS